MPLSPAPEETQSHAHSLSLSPTRFTRSDSPAPNLKVSPPANYLKPIYSTASLGGGRGSEGRRGETESGMGERSAACKVSNQNSGKRRGKTLNAPEQEAIRREVRITTALPLVTGPQLTKPKAPKSDRKTEKRGSSDRARASMVSSERTQPPNETQDQRPLARASIAAI